MGDVAVIRGVAIATCSVLAVGCVGAFLGSAAPVALAAGLGGNIAANWIDKHGPDALRSLLSGSLSLPRHDDMVRVADIALSAAIGHFLAEIKQDATGVAGADFTNSLKRLQEQAKSHTTRLPAAEADAAITQALTHLSNHGAAEALSLLLADAIAPDMRRGAEREYGAEWQALAHRLHTRLPDLLSAYLAEALKSDERFFRAVTVTLHAAQVQTGQDVLSVLQAVDQKLADLRAELTAWLPQDHGVDLTGFIKDVKESLAAIESAIKAEHDNDRAPPLTWPKPTAESGHDLSLLYFDRKATFVGRDDALTALNRFINDPAPLLWTPITGGAGVGKSRLVLEVLSLYRLTNRAEAGFMQPSDGWLSAKHYERWRAPVPTVLIIDYAGVSPELVRDLIYNLACRGETQALGAPVRLLLLDTHPNRGDFALGNRIKDSTSRGQQAKQVEWQDNARAALDLSPLPNHDLFTITELYRHAPLTAEEREWVRAAVAQDPELARPLFAALMGLALRHGSNSPLTLEGVTNHFLDRQEKHWAERDQITPLDRTLLALATLGGSLPLAVLDEPALDADGAALENVREHWALMTGKAWDDASPRPFTKLEPDFVGGLFILRHIQRMPKGQRRTPQQQRQERDRLITLAWKHGDPREPLVNLARNFAGVGDWGELLIDLVLYKPPGPDEMRWAPIAPMMAFALAHRGAGEVDRLLDGLSTCDGILGKEVLVLACFHSGLAAELGRHPRADNSLDRIRKLASDNPSNPTVVFYLAEGLVTSISYAGTDTLRMDQLLGELRTLVGDHKGDANTALSFSRGLGNAVRIAGTDTVRVDQLLDELRTLVGGHRGNDYIALSLSKGLCNAVGGAGTDTVRVDQLLDELRTLVGGHKGNDYIALSLSKGLYNAVLLARTDMMRVLRLLGELEAMANEYRGNADIALQFAMGLVNLTRDLRMGELWENWLLGELEAMANEYRGNADIALQFAMGLVNALDNPGKDPVLVDSLLGKLRALFRDYSGNADIALNLSKGLANAANLATTDTPLVERLLEELRTLFFNCERNPDIAQRLVRGLANAVYHGQGRFFDYFYLTELFELGHDYSDNREIVKLVSMAMDAFHKREANRGG